MNKSESIKELASALNKAQAEMSGAKKKATNPFFKSKYSDMNAVVDAIRIPFCDNGLSYSQFPLFSDKCVGVETIVEVAKECGWTLQQVCESFGDPSIKSVKDIPDLVACAAFLRSNKI